MSLKYCRHILKKNMRCELQVNISNFVTVSITANDGMLQYNIILCCLVLRSLENLKICEFGWRRCDMLDSLFYSLVYDCRIKV